jgi:hypothetical protein
LLSSGTISPANAQDFAENAAMESEGFDVGAPEVEMGGGDFFSQELGTLLRMRYNTKSYGQDRRGNLDLGTMRIANFEDSIAFFDGQVTLSDVNGVGYNLGVGFRWMGWNPFPLEPERITGFSFWADGSSTESGNFFPQVGVSYESLGDMWDLRVNGYIPVGQESQLGEFRPTGAVAFDENFLVLEAVADRNTSLNVGEAEIARRLMADRDAWAFAGPYVLGNSEQDALGYRVGVRGYAYPDLLVQLAVTDDDIFKTNAAVSVTWFVGRTRTNFEPAYGLADRMREPVMRNDYVALQRTTEVGGEPLTNTDGDPFRFVHVNRAAADGGNGTFENPLNNVGEVEPNSQDSDIVLLYSKSVFTNQNTLVLQDNQRLLGEGNNEFFTITTAQQGVVVIPETSPGARAGVRAEIVGTQGAGAVQLADLNEVANFNIDGTGSAALAAGIFSPGTGAGNPNIHDIDMRDVLGTGIQFTPLTRPNDTNPALSTVAGNVTIDDVNFTDMLGVEIDINSETATDVTNPNVTLQETVAISDINSQGGSDIGIWRRNAHASRTTTITNYLNGTLGTAGSGGGSATSGVLAFEGDAVDDFDGNVTLTNIDIFESTGYALHFSNIDSTSTTTITSGNGLTFNGGSGAAGGMQFNNFDGTINGNSSSIAGGTLSGVRVTGTSDGTINLLSTVTFDANNPGTDEAVINVGPDAMDSFTGTLTVAGAITNHNAGRLVSIQRVTSNDATVTLNGNMTDVTGAASEGILVADNTDGTILFGGILTVNTTEANAITLTDNTGADISFAGRLDLTADGSAAKAFTATGGGTLTVSATTNELSSDGDIGVQIEGMTISNAGANFSKLDAVDGAHGIELRNNTGGPITFGTLNDPVGDGGTITDTTDTAVVIDNSANVTISSMIINSPGEKGVEVTKNTTGTQTVNLNDLEIGDDMTAGSTRAIDVIGNGTGTLNMTINDVAIQNATERGIRVENIDTGTIQVNGTTIDGDGTTAGAQGVEIIGSNATFTFDSATTIAQFQGTDFEVDGGTTGSITYNGSITNTSGLSVHVHDRTGGSVQFSSTSEITDTGLGIVVEDNTGGTVSFLGTNDLDPSAAATEAVLVDNNTGATVNFAGLNINTAATGTARGFVAQGGGTVSVTGTTNVINTKNGAGLILDGMTIGSVDFQRIDVDGTADPVNAILLQNLTGGQVEIGTAGGADGSGGTVNATGNAIVINNAANVSLHDIDVGFSTGHGVAITKSNTAASTVTMDNVDVTETGGTSDAVNINVTAAGTLNVTATESDFASTVGGQAIDITGGGTAAEMNIRFDQLTSDGNDILATTSNSASLDFRLTNSDVTNGTTTMNINSSGPFDMLIENSTLTSTGGTTTFALNLGANSQDGDVIIRNNTITAGNSSAVAVVSNGTNSDVEFLLDTNTMSDGSAMDTVVASISGGAVFEATVTNNTITNTGGDELYMVSDGSSTRLDLNLDNNNAGAAGVYHLETLNQGVPTVDFNFGVVDRDDADSNNVGTINFDPAINQFEDIDSVPLPVLP